MAIRIDSLLKLPAEAAYSRHSGQATATVERKGEVIYVAATCDSLEREVEYYEELYYRARDALEQHENSVRAESKQRSEPIALPIQAFLIGFAAGALIAIAKNYKRNKK